MMKKTKLCAAMMMAAFTMMVAQPMTSMAAGRTCQVRVCSGNSINKSFCQTSGNCAVKPGCGTGLNRQNNKNCGNGLNGLSGLNGLNGCRK